MKKVMAIGAHPDDIEFGCGGTLIKHVDRGDEVSYICITGTESIDGVTGNILRSMREFEDELESARKILGINYMKNLGQVDLKVPFSLEVISLLEEQIMIRKPDIIYTHWAGDANQDHIATFKITMAASRYIKNVLCYEQIPIQRLTENNMTPQWYVKIDESFSRKMDASMAHKSQISKYANLGYSVEDNLETLAKYRGIQIGCKYAEAFQIIKSSWL